jgi:multicomponent Na+:H+ antiporter subunit E
MPTLLVFATCLVFWVLLSGHFSPLDLGAGLLACALVALHNRGEEELSAAVRLWPRVAVTYVPWLLREIVKSNLEVARIVLTPSLPIDPVVVRQTTTLRTPLGLTTYGNSITLTPGTVTLDVEGSTVVVHAITASGAQALLEGDMAARVARACGEAPA